MPVTTGWSARTSSPGARPARRQIVAVLRPTAAIPSWPPSYALLATFAAAIVVTAVVVLAGGTHHPAVALAAYAVLALVASLPAPLAVAPGSAAIAWLFDNGFIIGRHAVLSWHATADGERLGILLAAAMAGWALGTPARRRHRRAATAAGDAGVRASPPAGHTCD